MAELITGVVAGVFSGMGLGGGSILMLYLVLFLQTEHLKAAGINLMFFISAAAVSMFFHIKEKRIDIKSAVLPVLFGVCGAVAGSFLAHRLDTQYIRIGFGLLLLYIAIKEIINVCGCLFFKQRKG